MPAIGGPILVKYAGLIPINIRTYTTLYAPFNNDLWDFNDHSMIPMEFHGFDAGAFPSLWPTGLFANLIDVVTGYTSVSVGDNTPGNESGSFGLPCWQNSRLIGFAAGSTFYKNPVIYDYPAILGSNYADPLFSPVFGVSWPPNPNTGFPYPYTGSNWPCIFGVAASAEVALNEWNYFTDGNHAPGGGPFSISSSGYNVVNCIGPYNSPLHGEWSFLQMKDPADNFNRHRICFTDFFSAVSNIAEVYFENPPGGFDVDAWATNWINGIPTATDAGWLLISRGTATFGTQICVGFGILIKPDYSSYQVLQFIPRDAVAATWTIPIGDVHGKIDPHGALWLKSVNSKNTLYVSAGNVLKELPIFFPVPLADSTDDDMVVQMMRSFQT